LGPARRSCAGASRRTSLYIIESGVHGQPSTTPAGRSSVSPARTRFGEIGLLNQSARTATVTADAAGRLLEMDGPDFLDLVGAGSDVRDRLLGLYGTAGGTRTG
jgi:CRP-like cAMP-binding protein